MKTPFHRRCMEVARSRWAPGSVLFPGCAAPGTMKNMPHSSLTPQLASSIVGVTRSTHWIPRLFFFNFLFSALLLGKSTFNAFNTTQLSSLFFCVTCTIGNPVYAHGASSFAMVSEFVSIFVVVHYTPCHRVVRV